MISKIKSLSFCLPIIIFILMIFNACSMIEQHSESGSVSFRIDDSTVQKIAVAAKERQVTARAAEESVTLFLDVTISGGFSETKTLNLDKEATASFESVPVGVNITVSATAYSKEDDTRQNLYEGKSKPFTVRKGENQVVFLMKRIEVEETVTLPANIIFVANEQAGGASANDGSRKHPLDNIEHAVTKIHENVANGSVSTDQEWAIVLLSDLEGTQTVTTAADSDIAKLYISSLKEDDIKILNGGFDTPPATNDYVTNQTTLTNLSLKDVILQYIKITGGYALYGGGIRHQGTNLYLKTGAEIYGNKAVYKGAGIYISGDQLKYLGIDGGIVGGDDGNGNICTGANISGSGGGIFVGGAGEGYGSGSAVFEFTRGTIKGNKADNGSGVYVEGSSFVMMTGGTVTQNSPYTANTSVGGGFYIDTTNSSVFTMSGGSITGNSAQYFPGAYIASGRFNFGSNASFGSNDSISLSSVKINITDNLDNAVVPKIVPATYDTTVNVVTNGGSLGLAGFAEACAKFPIEPQSDGTAWYIGYDGNLTRNNPAVESNIPIYVSQTGTTDGDGSSAHPFATLENAVDYIRNNPYSKANFVVNISGTINGETYIGENIVAKSIKLVGANGVDGSGVPQDVLNGQRGERGVLSVVEQGLKVYIKDLKITNDDRGLLVGSVSYDQNGNETGKITSEVILESGVYITQNQGPGYDGAGIYISEDSTVTMNSGCVISNNNSGRGTCGGVYISGGTFLMQGGTISGSQAKNGAAAVFVGGRFEMSGDASIPFVDNKNYVTIPMLESQETPGIYSVMYPLVIAGDLSETTAATIATIDPYSEFAMRIPYVAGRQCVTEKTSGLLAGNHTKIAVEPAENPSENWIINENGQLVIQ